MPPTSLLLNPHATIAIDVRFYDEEEKKAFESWANAARITSITGTIIKVPVAEFLAYFLIHRKGLSPLRYPNLNAVKQEIQKGSNDLEDWVSYDGKTLHVRTDTEKLEGSFTEHLGEAAGLAVANRIHHLNEADWIPIPIFAGKNGRKTFDWSYASDGKSFIEMEAKGSFCERTDRLAGLSGHKASIKAKKLDLAKPGHPRFNQRALRYGTITSIGKDPNSLLTVRLVDPEGEIYDRTPQDARILKRLRWASWIIRLIAGRTHLSVALQNRLTVLETSQNPGNFGGHPLLGGTGKAMEGESFIERFFMNHSTSKELNAAGVLTDFDKDYLLFIGLAREWFSPLIHQKFGDLTELKFGPTSAETMIDCVVTDHQIETEFREILPFDKLRSGGFHRFKRAAVLHRSAAGFVFGLVSK